LSLRLRTFLVITATLLALFAVLYSASSAIMMKGFSELEKKEVQRQIARGRQVVNSLLEELGKHALDWATWDDTYEYMENGNEEYVRTNFPATTFVNLDFDFFLYFGTDGCLFSGFVHDGNGAVISPSDEFIALIRKNRQMVNVPQDLSRVIGVIRVNDRPILAAAVPILTSEGEGPSRGTLVIGRYLTAERLQKAADSAGLSLVLVPPADIPEILSPEKTELIRAEGEKTISGFFLVTDALGQSVVTFKVNASRWIFGQGRTSQHYLLLNLVASGIVIIVAMLLLVNRLVLARLARINHCVAQIRNSGDLNVRLPVKGKDELETLAVTINHTLDALQNTQETLRHDALHDPLTGLANRALLFQRTQEILDRVGEEASPAFALLLIDFDHFKLINDSYGHLAGDHLLVFTANRLSLYFRKEDVVARLGGDEFAVLLAPVADANEAIGLAKGLLDQLKEPMVWEDQPLYLSASIGVAMGLGRYSQPEQLLRDADTAMYRAKQGGRNGVALFHAAMRERVVERLALHNQLRGAERRGELRVFYQPLLELATERITGFEALVRWDHPELGLLTPDRFIPLAESGGFMGEIDTWVFQEVCQCLTRWQDQFGIGQSLAVSVNLSCLHSHLLDVIPELCQILARTGVPGCCLGLEITESGLSVAKKDFIRKLCELRDRGVRVYLDDFGTGHSSLSRLYDMPVDVLKIDRTFITELDSGKGEIAHAIIKMAHGLGMKVVAEGIEFEKQAAQLLAYGCDYGQGYLYSKPLSEENASRFLRNFFGKDRLGTMKPLTGT
jgi:diguanylate cyclase (GGDEF)-like protein